MKKIYTTILIILSISLYGQESNKVIIVDLDSINAKIEKQFIKEIKIEKTSNWDIPIEQLRKQIRDSTRLYEGNLFNIKQIGFDELLKNRNSYLVKGDIYSLSGDQLQTKSYKVNRKEVLKNKTRRKYEVNMSFGVGGESKLAIFPPRFHLNRINKHKQFNHYYGIGIGIHPHLLGGWGTLHIQTGIEYKKLDLETSISHLWTTSIEVDETETRGPWKQNLVNLKIGYLYNNNYSKLRLVISKVINEQFPPEQNDHFFIDFGKTGNFVFGIEYTKAIKN